MALTGLPGRDLVGPIIGLSLDDPFVGGGLDIITVLFDLEYRSANPADHTTRLDLERGLGSGQILFDVREDPARHKHQVAEETLGVVGLKLGNGDLTIRG